MSISLPLPDQTTARRFDPALLLLAPALLLTLVLFVYPFLAGLWLSFMPQQGGPLANYIRFFSDPFLYSTIFKTLAVAVPVALLSLTVSVPIALRVRLLGRWQRVLTTLLMIPITLGTVLVAEGLLIYLGPRGWLNRVLHTLGLIHSPVLLVHNFWGVLLSQIVVDFPFVFLMTLTYVSGLSPSLERASAVMGAQPFQRFRHIILPLLTPGLMITFGISFVQTFSVFPSAMLVGAPAGPTRVIAVAAYHAAFEDYDSSMGSAIAMIMATVQGGAVGLLLLARGFLYRGPSAGGKG